jgi:hypothetical protein
MSYVSMGDIDNTAHDYYFYESYVKSIYPDSWCRITWGSGKLHNIWGKYVYFHKIMANGSNDLNFDIGSMEKDCHTLGKRRAQIPTAWKSAYLELKKLEALNEQS